MADRRLVQARGPFVTMTANGPWAVHAGDLYWSDDPVAAAHPEGFDDPLVQDSSDLRRQPRGWAAGPPSPGRIETATAEPGSVRAPTRPPAQAVTTDAALPPATPPTRRPAKATARPDGEV
jgi:hypothetical protein